MYGCWNHGNDLDDTRFTGGQMLLEVMKPIRWVGLAVVGLTCFVVHNPIAVAQHGEAEAGLYTFDYHGDTWTGR